MAENIARWPFNWCWIAESDPTIYYSTVAVAWIARDQALTDWIVTNEHYPSVVATPQDLTDLVLTTFGPSRRVVMRRIDVAGQLSEFLLRLNLPVNREVRELWLASDRITLAVIGGILADAGIAPGPILAPVFA